jgi:hypothetical protein
MDRSDGEVCAVQVGGGIARGEGTGEWMRGVCDAGGGGMTGGDGRGRAGMMRRLWRRTRAGAEAPRAKAR